MIIIMLVFVSDVFHTSAMKTLRIFTVDDDVNSIIQIINVVMRRIPCL